MHRTGGPPGRRTRQLDTAHLPDSVTIAVTDGEARVAYWSREAEDLLGYTSAEIIGRPLDDLVGADGAPLRHRDGSLLDTKVHLSPLLGATQQHFLVTTVPSPGTGRLQDLMWWMLEQQSPVSVDLRP
ncbi:PAS domain-containing protein [Streptomyces sp. NPDC013978]|uniref:PAS domain-containing protein n=1 Tax=Streptomyces sp. NPDC013978 TaxID=3364869 RepID=UPI0036FBA1C7